ncbi:carbohydrate kinase family protein [Marinobacter sp. DUT-1]|uniref:carbohydrate kinase family protein n=1 Tax=Marinobacter sp. DUT-1 TaxID=3412037 RepID=UPI003D166D5A
MSDILCFGEALIDMRGEQGEGGVHYVPQPGGAPANVAVGVARLGGRAGFVGQVGNDVFGQTIVRALAGYGVDTSRLAMSDSALTALAIVSLDDQGERSFSFYRNATADLLYRPDQLPESALGASRIFHLCSNTLTEPAIRETSQHLMARARQAGCLVSFDVNFRPGLWPAWQEAPEIIGQIARQADIVKFSREELEQLYGENAGAVPDTLQEQGVPLVVVSDGAATLRAFAGREPLLIEPPRVRAVDTTAAGDSFVAGLLFRLWQDRVSGAGFRQWLTSEGVLADALKFASRCGAITATRFGAFDALPEPKDLKAFSK